MIRLLVIATALLYGQALIVCGGPEDEVLRGAEQLSVGTEIDSVRFQDAVTRAMPLKIAASDAGDCYLQKIHRLGSRPPIVRVCGSV